MTAHEMELLEPAIRRDLRSYRDNSTESESRKAGYATERDDIASEIHRLMCQDWHMSTLWEARRAVADRVYQHLKALRAIY